MIEPARITFDAAPIAVGRDFVVYGAALDGERVVVKAGLPHHERAPAEASLRREHDALVRVGKVTSAVPEVRGLTTLGDGRVALVTRFVEGLPLSVVIDRALVRRRYQGARRWNAATRELFAALCQAVASVHGQGLVHNDLKPENILVREKDGRIDVVLLDFALAAKDERGGPGGTVAYAAPERLEGAAGTVKSDVWALGAMLYELLAGTRPYPSDQPADAIEARRHAIDRLPRDSAARAWAALPPEVQAALRKSLARDPKDRPRNVRAFVKLLDVRTTPSPAPTPRTKRPSTSWRLIIGGILALIGGAIGVGLGLAAAHHGASPTPAPMCLDEHGVDACRTALTNPTFARVFGLPVAAWAAALHAVLLAAIGIRLIAKRGNLALVTLTLILLAGTTAYLVIGLAIVDVRCTLCLAMHGAALVVGVGAILVIQDLKPALRNPRAWAGVLGALAGWVALAVLITGLARPRAALAAAPSQPAASTCPAPIQHARADLPSDDASIVLSDAAPDRPVLVELLDLECSACRGAHAALAPLYRELAQTRRAGLRLVLKSADTVPARAAPAALICAARHGGPLAALDFIDWELRASPGYYTPEDRRRWLGRRLDRAATRCLDDELRAGGSGTLAAHATWADDIRSTSAARDTCGDATNRNAWWCWVGTPSFGVFRTNPTTTASEAMLDGLSTVSEAARNATLAQCLER